MKHLSQNDYASKFGFAHFREFLKSDFLWFKIVLADNYGNPFLNQPALSVSERPSITGRIGTSQQAVALNIQRFTDASTAPNTELYFVTVDSNSFTQFTSLAGVQVL